MSGRLALVLGRLPTGHAAGAALVEHARDRDPTPGDAFDALADAAAVLAADDELTDVQLGAIGRHLAAAWEIRTHAG